MPLNSSTSNIVAQAFRYVELGRPSSFEDDDPLAQDAAQTFPEAMRICLEACDWSFASKIVKLPEIILPADDGADDDLPYTFAVPGDVVTVQEVGDAFTAWRLDRAALRADQPAPLRLRYTVMLQDEQHLPSTFRDAVALRLACLLGARWLTTSTKMQDLEARADKALKEAMRRDARSASAMRTDDLPPPGDWVSEALR